MWNKLTIAYCVVAFVMGGGLLVSQAKTRALCSPPPQPVTADCSKQGVDTWVTQCIDPSGRVFIRWRDGRWLEVVPKEMSL